jgi:hypothetical protein
MDKFDKQPDEVLDYDVDFSEWLTGGDTIQSHSVAADAGIVVDSSTVSAPTQTVKVWLSGGTDGVTYKVTVTVVTVSGRTKQKEFKVKVKER